MWWMAWSCTHENTDTPPAAVPNPLLDVAETASVEIPSLDGEAYVVRTTADVPYVYGATREDVARASGFVLATDRFFTIDMIRRLAQGRLSEVLGDEALAADQSSRGIGMTRVTDDVLRIWQTDTELAGLFDAYAEGVNAYIAEVNSNRLPPPSEYVQLGPLLGAPDVKTLLVPFDRRDMAGVAAALIFQLGFDDTDLARAEAWEALDGLFDGAPNAALRQAGVEDDIFARVEQIYPISSAPGFGTAVARAAVAKPTAPPRGPRRVEASALRRLRERTGRLTRLFGHDRAFGSNAWAVSGAHTADGRALLSGDGHLPLSVPSLFYQIGMDTELLGGGDLHQVGLALQGFPTLAVGTNGEVAWSQTALYGDITDWYTEVLQLGPDGRPATATFQGEDRPLVAVDETYVVAEVAILGSVGRTETWTRYETFDGRLLTEVEGRLVDEGATPGPGEAVIDVQGVRLIPDDVDGDGRITAISLDHTAFDHGNLALASQGFGAAEDVWQFREATKKLVAYSQNLVAADSHGDILYSGYQAVPCRGYLTRNPDGTWVDGASPMMLVDGTRFGGFTIPVNLDGTVDESRGADPYQCVVPFEEYPQSVSPDQGYVVTANNDIGNLSTDGSLTNDKYYLGGPWVEGYRAQRISDRLAEEVAAGTADLDAMQDVQADHRSGVGEQWAPILLEALDAAEAAAGGSPAVGSAEERMAALWTADAERLAEVRDRLLAWGADGYAARSGVKTFYADPSDQDRRDAVATTLFHAWMSEVVMQTFDDEGMPDVWFPDADTAHLRVLKRMVEGRGPRNPQGMASWDPATEESVFFDLKDTPEVETSRELFVRCLRDALDALTAPSSDPGYGGFGTADMDGWLWGYRHMVRFESILGQVLSAEDDFGFLIELFSITPDLVPLDADIPFDDPRARLPWFPRDGDMVNVDAGDPGFDRGDWTYGSGPVFRMVIALGPDGPEGRNVLPGGQSGLKDSAFFADQARLWLGNETMPMLTTVDAVKAAAIGRITLHP